MSLHWPDLICPNIGSTDLHCLCSKLFPKVNHQDRTSRQTLFIVPAFLCLLGYDFMFMCCQEAGLKHCRHAYDNLPIAHTHGSSGVIFVALLSAGSRMS